MMACSALQTGHGFLAGLLGNIDCQAQTFGAFGFAALSDPASGAFLALSALLTIFIALFGLRLLMGDEIAGRDLILAVLKIGIVLTLATSWPAWRILGYDLVTRAPGELATTMIGAAGTPGARDLVVRLQGADDAIVVMTAAGSGRLTGGIAAGADVGDSFHGVALSDQTGLGWGRLFFLVGTLAPLGLLKLVGGILVGIAPLMAGLLLFAGTQSIFLGWLRGLALTALGALVLALIYSAELAVMEPWLSDVLAQRHGNVLTPSAPTELVALTLTFAMIALASVGIIARVAFFGNSVLTMFAGKQQPGADRRTNIASSMRSGTVPVSSATGESVTRAQLMALSLSDTVRREESTGVTDRQLARPAAAADDPVRQRGEVLGESWRRNRRRPSAAGARRDARA